MAEPAEPNLIPVVLCDIDGTLADDSLRRLAHPDHSSPDFDLARYEQASIDDPPIPYVVETIRQLSRSYSIVIMTGRMDTAAEVTAEWLDRYRIQWDELMMRRPGDEHMTNTALKLVIYDEVAVQMERWIELAIDNNPDVVEAFNQRGVNTMLVTRPDQ